MKKQDFIKAVAAAAEVSNVEASKVINTAIEVITEELTKGGEVNITGFGVFKVSNRAARNGVNPKTKEKIKIPATKSPSFKAGKTLKETIKAA